MNYYLDIRIKPDEEMRENVLLNKVYSKFHKALFEMGASDIGVSFPNTKVLLGRVMRIHSTQERLSELVNKNWLGGMVGYCNIGEISLVPDNVSHRVVSRWQSNMSESKLRRAITKHDFSKQQIKAYRAKMFSAQMTTLPYLELESTSTKKLYRRYIQMSELQTAPTLGKFDSFGLSSITTVPWF